MTLILLIFTDFFQHKFIKLCETPCAFVILCELLRLHFNFDFNFTLIFIFIYNPFIIFAPAMETIKKDIRALTKEQLREFFIAQGDKEFRGNQVYEWLWNKGAHHFEDMTNLSKETRQMLDDNFVINHI